MTKQQVLSQIQHCDDLIYRINNTLRKADLDGDYNLAVRLTADRIKLSRTKTDCMSKLALINKGYI